jgi:hypothetical protein
MPQEIEDSPISVALRQLITDKYVFAFGEFYTLQNNSSLWEKRIKGNRHAEQLLKTAYKISRLLYQFPL